ncbi:MAG: SP_1767 family glycosyltransferase [Oscillospiraceae bacterium]|nr:SP_1767 family glycosyltransferase [Oscillospiraceae bacterium]
MGIIRNKLLYELEKLNTWFQRSSCKWMRQPDVIGMTETISAIRDRRASIARYGDGEFDIIFGRTEGYQKTDMVLSMRLKTVLKQNDLSDRFLVALPDCFGSLDHFIPAAQNHWRIRLDRERIRWVGLLNTKAPYYQAQITRFYYDWADKSQCQGWYEGLKQIWQDENVLIVEGDKSRVGVGNDLFDNAKSVRRLLCPSENAFSHYDEILEAVKQAAKQDDLIFMALGPTATVLAYDLFRAGLWAFDAGHIDLEYEWMRLGATEKVKIPGKYVNEVSGGDQVADVTDDLYLSQIIGRVGT